MGLRLVTGPTEYPVTVEEMQRHLNIDAEDDDLVLDAFIKAATTMIESLMDQSFVQHTWEYSLDYFPGGYYDQNSLRYYYSWPSNIADRPDILLPRGPVISVNTVAYTDGDGVEQTIDAANYSVDLTGTPARIVPNYGYVWPTTSIIANAVRVEFDAGYVNAVASDPPSPRVPENIKAAIMVQAAFLFQYRGDEDSPAPDGLHPTAKALMRKPLVLA